MEILSHSQLQAVRDDCELRLSELLSWKDSLEKRIAVLAHTANNTDTVAGVMSKRNVSFLKSDDVSLTDDEREALETVIDYYSKSELLPLL